ncbi:MULTISPECIES: fibrobacter succinogenes major paralogous domain-containing protein [unclassified Fibrobacter]|jgi:uncharacterized protein (TIGR02145 family)|uniref:fibrobacter succinogenes major paralogous domain-containing protein n=1 Tax=unclassified Fibrobacter TaxID=2634177 RepID=UPI0025B839C1|nr:MULTISPECIES: fibrobacter succinogenes major paralogous domain-containing protein [unclassified Fibrobacter]
MKKLLIIAAGIALLMTGCNKEIPLTVNDRDGNTYKVIKIGKQVWMAQNLNVRTEDSWCYDDNPANCEKYGRLYTWDAAAKACPEGWRLPSKDEWEDLFDAVGGSMSAAKKLKSTYGWKEDDGESGNGTDDFAFTALPAGARDKRVGSFDEGYITRFWSSTEISADLLYNMGLSNSGSADLGSNGKSFGISVRCIFD